MDFNRTEIRSMRLATGLLLLGAAARLGLGPGPAELDWTEPVGTTASRPRIGEVRRQVEEGIDAEARSARPLSPGERLDPNSAPIEELRRLPGIGPARAAAIDAERASGLPFRQPEDLARVAGIGNVTVARLRPFLRFGSAVPGKSALTSPAAGEERARINVNRAQIKDLEQITGIGPVLAARIVEARMESGAFSGPEDLLRVPGIGPGILQRIRGQLQF